MVRPSGVFTETALNFGSCARPGAETVMARNAANGIAARLRRGIAWVMGFLRWRDLRVDRGSRNAEAACTVRACRARTSAVDDSTFIPARLTTSGHLAVSAFTTGS